MLQKHFLAVTILHTVFICTGADYAKYAEAVKELSRNETFVKLFDEHVKLFQENDKSLKLAPFTCNNSYATGKAKATSVHQLRPTDINVIAALGDSITAGTGITANTVIGLLREDRGLSWSIGGDATIETEDTLPNMLKVYNENINGYSTGWGPVWIESSSRFNLAEPGDKSEDIPRQAQSLVQRMMKDKSIDYQEDWKIITIFVGGNDLCDFCEDKTKYGAESYVANLQAGLDILHKEIPKAFVNVVQILDIAIVKKLNANFVCDTLHLFGCKCAAFPANSDAEKELQAETERYRSQLRELIDSGRYDTRDDFTVVEQPFFTETAPPDTPDGEPDLSYFAPDCFHLSLKGHRAASEALWNNMLEPYGKKRTKWTPDELVECPSNEVPFFYTRKNSAPTNDLGDEESINDIHFKQDLKTEDMDSEGESNELKFPLTAVGTSTAALIGIVLVAVFTTYIFRKRNRIRAERERLLAARRSPIYT